MYMYKVYGERADQRDFGEFWYSWHWDGLDARASYARAAKRLKDDGYSVIAEWSEGGDRSLADWLAACRADEATREIAEYIANFPNMLRVSIWSNLNTDGVAILILQENTGDD